MDNKVFIQRYKAILKLIDIEKEYEAFRDSKHLFRQRNWHKTDSSDERKEIEMKDLDILDQHLLRIYGRNLKMNEIKKIYDSEPWSKGFNLATSPLMRRYFFLTDSNDISRYLSAPTDDTIEDFKVSGVISQSTLKEMIDHFKTPDAMAKGRESISDIFKAARRKINNNYITTDAILKATLKETTEDFIAPYDIFKSSQKDLTDASKAKESIPKISKETNSDSQTLVPISKAIQESMSVEINCMRDIRDKEVKSESYLNIADSSDKLPNLFPFFLCMRTNAFMFPSIPVDKDGKKSSSAEALASYRFLCLEFATQISIEAVEFSKKAKVSCALTISIFEELFHSFRFNLPSSSFEDEYGKKLMREMFAELYALEREIVEQKRRCTKFLIDVDVFLYHDSPLPKNEDGSWTDQQRYLWKLIIIRTELATKLLQLLISKLKEIQTDFILQYKAFLAFCNLKLQ